MSLACNIPILSGAATINYDFDQCKNLWLETKSLESSLNDPFQYQHVKIENIISESQEHKKEFPSSQHELSKLLAQFIELDKMMLKAGHKDQDFYAKYPTYEVMKAFQAVPVDLDHNTYEDWLSKIKILKESILTFARKHVSPMEFYISLIKHQLDRG